ncbi:MAG: tRNA glutamyl-Q(34) synthetase GluQRS [Planctomycetaceae bacterium]|nr:tRNA glutamyl-Q(34) synthetase GluQRS [Planctomycetaceae bacterium]
MSSESPIRCARLAPSPTGAQHVGNARTFLLAWFSARSQGAQVILRIEDIDSPRVKPWAMAQAADDLRWLGLDWDAGPVVQTTRLDVYRALLDDLKRRELVYPCICTRSDVDAAASAPHVGQEGPLYPGTCRHLTVGDAAALGERPYAWRFRVDETAGVMMYHDLVAGPQRCNVATELGDFVVGKSDGSPAYQLAVVADDHAMGMTEVIRGDDLIPSTFRQMLLYAAMDWSPPSFAHVPLVIGPDGRRLAKRHGDTRLSVLRDAGVPPERLIGLLAWSCGLQGTTAPIMARDLLTTFDWQSLPRSPFVFAPAMWSELMASNA